MPAAAMAMRRRSSRTPMRGTPMRRTIMAIIITAMITITTTSIAITTITTVIPMLMTTSKPPPLEEPGGMTEAEGAALYRLMAWLSPAYPVGAFSYSSGIEWAVEAGDITDATTLQRWLTATIGNGGGFCDAAILVHAYRAAAGNDDQALKDVAELAAALAPSKERFLETTAQGRAFIEATRAAWPCIALSRLAATWEGPLAYPVAVGLAA